MMDWGALKAEIALPAHDGLADAQVAAALNAATIDAPQPVPALTVERYLRVVGKMAAIEDAAQFEADGDKRRAARAMVGALRSFASFDLSVPAYRAAVERDLGACVTAGFVSAEDVAAIVAMGTAKVSRAQQLGWTLPLTVTDIANARSAP